MKFTFLQAARPSTTASWLSRKSFVKRIKAGASQLATRFGRNVLGRPKNETQKKRINRNSNVHSILQRLSVKGQRMMDNLEQLIKRSESADANRLFTEVKEHYELYHDIEDIVAGWNMPNHRLPTFVISSELIYDAFHRLSKIRTESILYASGSRFDELVTIERLIPLHLDASELGYASANFDNSTQVLIRLEEFGSVLSAYFHMHPGKGANSNMPSGIDMANQERLERGGFLTIGGIFSRDGHLRFFSDKLQYGIQVIGKDVEHVGQNTYKLTKDQNLSM